MTVKSRQQGFTLIEIILTIVLAALAGLAAFVFLGGVVTRSVDPVIMVQDLAASRQGMEAATVEYQSYLAGNITWAAFKTALDDAEISYTTVTLNPGDTFEVIEATMTTGQQTISALFSE